MVGASFAMELLVYPAIFAIWKSRPILRGQNAKKGFGPVMFLPRSDILSCLPLILPLRCATVALAIASIIGICSMVTTVHWVARRAIAFGGARAAIAAGTIALTIARLTTAITTGAVAIAVFAPIDFMHVAIHVYVIATILRRVILMDEGFSCRFIKM